VSKTIGITGTIRQRFREAAPFLSIGAALAATAAEDSRPCFDSYQGLGQYFLNFKQLREAL
jgi:hypothetical protein